MRKPKDTKCRTIGGRMPFVYATAERVFNANFAGDDPAQACLYWAKAAQVTLSDMGYRAIIQAGSAFWRRSAEWEFGYLFSGEVQPGNFLEWHCWVGLPDEGPHGLIVDISTGFQAERCRITTGFSWSGKYRLGNWICASPKDLPRYTAEPGAIHHARESLRRSSWGETADVEEFAVFYL